MTSLIRNTFACLLTVGVLLVGDSSAQADPISFYFTANYLTSGSTLAGLGLTNGTTIMGSLTFDDGTPDSIPEDPERGSYAGALSSLSFDIFDVSNSVVTSGLASNGIITVSNGSMVPPANGQDAYAFAASPLTGQIGSFNTKFFNLLLTDTSANAFSDDLLPSTLPELSDFNIPRVIVAYSDGTNFETATYSLTSLTDSSPVPVPATMLLLCTGLAGLGVFRKKFKRS